MGSCFHALDLSHTSACQHPPMCLYLFFMCNTCFLILTLWALHKWNPTLPSSHLNNNEAFREGSGWVEPPGGACCSSRHTSNALFPQNICLCHKHLLLTSEQLCLKTLAPKHKTTKKKQLELHLLESLLLKPLCPFFLVCFNLIICIKYTLLWIYLHVNICL